MISDVINSIINISYEHIRDCKSLAYKNHYKFWSINTLKLLTSETKMYNIIQNS